MKNILFTFAILCAMVFANAAVSDGWLVWQMDTTTIDTNGAYDTLGATDSTTILTNFEPVRGWNYYLGIGTLSGTGSDSVAMEIRVDCKNENKSVLANIPIDTTTLATGIFIKIPFAEKTDNNLHYLFGEYFDVKLRTYTGAGSQIIIGRLYLYRAMPVITEKRKQGL